MVKKLFKHEFIAWLRISWIAAAVVLTLAGVHRLLQCFESNSPIYILVNVLFLLIYFLTLVVAMYFPTVFAVVRFYKNLFTGEGYLSFTLPVTPTQHLWVKALTATVMTVGIGLVCLLSGMLITAGDIFTEVCKLFGYYLGKLNASGVWHLIGWCLEITLLFIVSAFSGHLLFYACICLGQRFRKHRLLAAVGVYFIYYYASQFLGVILAIVMEILEYNKALDPLYKFFFDHTDACIHISLTGSTLLTAALGLACFLICRHTMTHKLNLE